MAIFDEARGEADPERQKRLAKWACVSQSRQRIEAMVTLARPDLALTPDRLDRDPWLLNVENGTLDLSTGTLRPHDRTDLITRVCVAPFDAAAECPRWRAFLAEIFGGDDDLIDFVHRAAGYTVTGGVREQVFFVLHGSGANGKRVFISTLRHVLGPYAFDPGFGIFEAATRFAPHPEHLASLAGVRFVTASETAENTRLNEQRLKVLAHGDTTSARFLYGQRFEFTPVGKIWLCVNHKPRVDDDSLGFWRSAHLIPFGQQFVGPAADLALAETLRGESAGILAWLVDGCRRWQEDGLGQLPEAVSDATSTWRSESDPLADFLASRCVFGPLCQATAGELFGAYDEWARSEGLPERTRLTLTAFGRRLGDRFERVRSREGGKRRVAYQGIGLLATAHAGG